MKIAILGFTKISYMPYLHFYLEQIDRSRNEVHLLYWKRDGREDSAVPEGVKAQCLGLAMEDSIPLMKKLPKLLRYRSFAIKALKQIDPDFIIVLHSTTGITVHDFLTRKYRGRYIFDYRDVTYEGIGLYRNMVSSLVEGAALTFTSSDGFRKYLPTDAQILTSHNLTREVLTMREGCQSKQPSEKIRVAFWGLLRHRKINEAITKALAEDGRFELHYYGRAQGGMAELMSDACKRYDCVYFHGEYKPSQRAEFARQTDILHNLYDNSDKTTPIAMGNKYYDGAIFYLPQLCTDGSFMADAARHAGIGEGFDPYAPDFAERVYDFYTGINRERFMSACDVELSRILGEVEAGEKRIKEVLENAVEKA